MFEPIEPWQGGGVWRSGGVRRGSASTAAAGRGEHLGEAAPAGDGDDDHNGSHSEGALHHLSLGRARAPLRRSRNSDLARIAQVEVEHADEHAGTSDDEAAVDATAQRGSDDQAPALESLSGGWQQYEDHAGMPYFYSTITGDWQYEDPRVGTP